MKRGIRALTLMAVAFREQVTAEKSHLANFWFGMLGKLAYNVMFIFFIDQLFARVGQFAGYDKNDFYFLFFVSQLGFYLCYYGIFFPMQRLVESVRNGNFDLLLLKPVPHRAFLYISGMQMYELLLTAAPSMLIMAFMINWLDLAVSPLSVMLGFVVWVCGIIVCNTMVFALALPVFKTGEASDMLNKVFYNLTAMSQMPFSKLPLILKVSAFVVFPQIIIAGAASEVLLMKVDMFAIAGISAGAATVSIFVANLLWKYALRNYTSVSS